MRQRSRRLNPFQAVFCERQLTKKRRTDRQRVDRRTNVVNETRQGQLGRTNRSANLCLRLINDYGFALLSQHDRSRQTIGSGADHHCVIRVS